jgi:integrase
MNAAAEPLAIESATAPALRILPKYRFVKAKDGRGREIDGLWVRNGRFYYQISVPGKGCRRVPLLDETNQPVKSIQQAKDAIEGLRRKKREGEILPTQRAPVFDEFAKHYLAWMEELGRKKPKTLVCERSILNGWIRYFRSTRLNKITLRDVTAYVLARKNAGVGHRAINLDVLVLGNVFRFAKEEGAFTGKLPTEGWKPLPYKAEKQRLLTKEEIDKFCAVAVSKNPDGTPRFKNGEMLVDAVRLMSLSGGRVRSAFALRWEDIDWERRQVHFKRDTKYSKHIIVDFNPELEALLKELYQRRQPDSDAVFPSTREDSGTPTNCLRKTFELVREAAGMPYFKFHGLRHYFISHCVMSATDLLTVAAWAGHADTLLISRVYGHLNDKHKQQAASKLSFGTRNVSQEPGTGSLVDLNKLTAAELLQLLQQKMQGEQVAKT